jgi:2-haloacid dehalogenase
MAVTTPSPSTAPLKGVQAVLFDAYGTLFDVYSVALLAEQMFPGQGQALSVLWRDKQIDYTRLVSASRRGPQRASVYQPFWELTRAGLRYACKRLGLDLSPECEERLMNQYRHLSAFPENHAVLRTLKERGLVTGVLSNGDPAMLEVAVKSAGLAELLDHVISVDAVRTYKTDPQAYALGEQATGLKTGQIAFVSSNGWDALAATWYGYQTLWVNRYGLPQEEIGPAPLRVVPSLTGVLDMLA